MDHSVSCNAFTLRKSLDCNVIKHWKGFRKKNENHNWDRSTSIYRSPKFTFPPGHFKHRVMIYEFPRFLQINAGTIHLNHTITGSFYAIWKSLFIYNINTRHQAVWITGRILSKFFIYQLMSNRVALKNIKIYIKTAPTYFGLITIIRQRISWVC